MSECGSKEGCCSCQESQCSCPCHESSCEEECGKEEFFLSVADEAWTEVLKDKIKEHILSTQDDRMTELAKIVAEANGARWRNKMEKKQGCMMFDEQLARFFSQGKKK